MDDAEVQEALHLAVLLNLHRLPQLKGKGKVINPDVRSSAVRAVAAAIVEQLALSGIILLKAPPAAGHGAGYGIRRAED